MPKLFLFLIPPSFVLILSCGPEEQEPCYNNHYANVTDYEILADKITAGGIRVDTSGFEVDLNEIDKKTSELENCLRNVFQEQKNIHPETAKQYDCREEGGGVYKTEFEPNLTIRRECLVVKIAPDWYTSPCSGMQVFLGKLPPDEELCEAKGLEKNPECPCAWRSVIEDNSVVVTTPNLFLYKGELGRMVTGCSNPWFAPIAQCLFP